MHDFNSSRRAPGHLRAAAAWLIIAVAGLAARLALPSWRSDGALVSAVAGIIGLAFAMAALARSEGLAEGEREAIRRRSRIVMGALIVTLAALAAVVLGGR